MSLSYVNTVSAERIVRIYTLPESEGYLGRVTQPLRGQTLPGPLSTVHSWRSPVIELHGGQV